MRPMLATRGREVPSGTGWLHEIKWDGFRVLVEVRDGAVRVASRTERDVTVAFPELAALGLLPDVLLDAEIVVFEDGAPVIHGVAERFQVTSETRAAALAELYPATLMVFDILEAMGDSIIGRALEERRRLLEVLPLEDTGVARISQTYDDAAALLDAVREHELEGIVSKRKLSTYRPGVRSSDWLKFPLRTADSFVIGGYRWEKGGGRIGSLLLGEPTASGLAYRGRVALSVPTRTERAVAELLAGSEIDEAPFAEIPDVEAREVTWVRPEHVVDVEFLLRTADGRLRHPTYRGLRSDLSPSDLG